MARKVRYTAFRDKPGRSCGHLHKTAKATSECAVRQKKQYGGTWNVRSASYSH